MSKRRRLDDLIEQGYFKEASSYLLTLPSSIRVEIASYLSLNQIFSLCSSLPEFEEWCGKATELWEMVFSRSYDNNTMSLGEIRNLLKMYYPGEQIDNLATILIAYTIVDAAMGINGVGPNMKLYHLLNRDYYAINITGGMRDSVNIDFTSRIPLPDNIRTGQEFDMNVQQLISNIQILKGQSYKRPDGIYQSVSISLKSLFKSKIMLIYFFYKLYELDYMLIRGRMNTRLKNQISSSLCSICNINPIKFSCKDCNGKLVCGNKTCHI